MKLKRLSLLLVLLLIISTLFPTITKADELELVEIHTCIINGVQRTLSADENGKIYLTIEGQNPKYIYFPVLDAGFDKDGTVWIIDYNTSIAFYSYDLFGFENISFFYITQGDDFSEITDLDSLVFETSENQKYVTGYKTISGENYPTLTLDEIKNRFGISDEPTPPPATPTPGSTITPTPTPPQDPTPTPPSKTDTTTQNQQNTVKQPTVTQNSSSKISIKKSSGYTCLSVGNKVVSKYKLKKGVLTWKGAKKSKKVKQVKQVGFIKKSKNLVYITKKGKAYTISQKGKKKTIVKKNAKKLIFKNGYVTKIKKKSGYTSVVNK